MIIISLERESLEQLVVPNLVIDGVAWTGVELVEIALAPTGQRPVTWVAADYSAAGALVTVAGPGGTADFVLTAATRYQIFLRVTSGALKPVRALGELIVT